MVSLRKLTVGEQMKKKTDRNAYILGVVISSSNMEQVLKKMVDRLVLRHDVEMMMVFTPNPEQVMLAQRDDRFCHTLNQSTVNVADGVGLVWADWWLSRRLGEEWRIRERVAGIELAEALVREAMGRKKRVFLLGGGKGVGGKAITRFQVSGFRFQPEEVDKNKKGMMSSKELGRYVDWYEGAEDIATETIAEQEEALARIVEHKTEVLLVAYGAPWQEFWVMANREQLEKVGVKVVMVVGGALDVWAGKVKRAPVEWRKIGLEWLWRLILQPWRLGRQLALLGFVFRVVRHAKYQGNKVTR